MLTPELKAKVRRANGLIGQAISILVEVRDAENPHEEDTAFEAFDEAAGQVDDTIGQLEDVESVLEDLAPSGEAP